MMYPPGEKENHRLKSAGLVWDMLVPNKVANDMMSHDVFIFQRLVLKHQNSFEECNISDQLK